jgi:hypothetical protein
MKHFGVQFLKIKKIKLYAAKLGWYTSSDWPFRSERAKVCWVETNISDWPTVLYGACHIPIDPFPGLISRHALHSPRSGFPRPQDSTPRINHCYDSANSGCFVERGRCDRRCTQHAKIPSGSSLPFYALSNRQPIKKRLMFLPGYWSNMGF